MAIYRPLQVSFWDDPYILELNPGEKLFYIYLLTNDKTKQCGIYEIPITKMEMELKYSGERLFEMLNKFQNDRKIVYSIETREIAVINWLKYNPVKSFNTAVCVAKELKEVKNSDLVLVLFDVEEQKTFERKYKDKQGNEKIISVILPNPKDNDLHSPYIAPTIPPCSNKNKNKHKNKHKHNNNESLPISFEGVSEDNFTEAKEGCMSVFISAWKRSFPEKTFNEISFNIDITKYRRAEKLNSFSNGEIQKAIENFSTCVNNSEYRTVYKTAIKFLDSIDDYMESADPFNSQLDFEVAKEKRYQERFVKEQLSELNESDESIIEELGF